MRGVWAREVELQLLPVRPEGHLDDDDATTSVLYLAFGAAYIGSSPYFEFANTPLEFPDVLLCHSGSMYVAGEVRFMWVVVLVGVS